MTKTAFIWDLDGTLVDSYPAILAGLEETYEHFALPFHREEVLAFISRYSVRELLAQVADERGLNLDDLQTYRSHSQKEKATPITLMTGAREVLDWTQEKGIANFIYTHKDNRTFALLEQLKINHHFTEVITIDTGFRRKPAPEAIDYLIEKYQLTRQTTYYIGDRLLDVQVAQQAGILSLNLHVDNQPNNRLIAHLTTIKTLLDGSD